MKDDKGIWRGGKCEVPGDVSVLLVVDNSEWWNDELWGWVGKDGEVEKVQVMEKQSRVRG